MSGTCAPIFQFPPPRGGEPTQISEFVITSPISIPAPARGRTVVPGGMMPWALFQFPPPRGGEPWLHSVEHTQKLFQFPPPRGGEPAVRNIGKAATHISIPAPARGRTSWMPPKSACATFQFPPPRGGEHIRVFSWFDRNLFQFPPPRGGEPQAARIAGTSMEFQFPPPRGGERSHTPACSKWSTISIPAPARGRTICDRGRRVGRYFNSRPREGANRRGEPRRPGARISIPAPARGRTSPGAGKRPVGISIPAPARGRTVGGGCSGGDLSVFQFPPPRGGEPVLFGISRPMRKYFNSRPREGAN